MRTVALRRFLADSGLRARGDRGTNKAEAYNGFSAWTPVRQPGRDRRERPRRAGKSVKWNSLLCNLIVFHTAIDVMEVIRQLVAEGWQVTAEDLAQLSPDLTSHILRFGAYATDELHIPPDVFDFALDEVDFGGEQPAAAWQGTVTQQRVV
jgi:Tn3 transposase DDE domain